MVFKIAWVTRSFLDYRIPVFLELNKLVRGNLFLFYSGDYIPESVQEKAKQILKNQAVPLYGEWKIGGEDRHHMANRNISIRYQPGIIKKLKELQPDVIVCDGFFKWTLPALFYRFFFRTPIVINYERTFHTERNVQWFRTLYRKAVVKITDAMDCNGKLCAEYTMSLGMPEDRITTGHMNADTNSLELKAKNTSSSRIAAIKRALAVDGIVFTCVGRLHSLKGCHELLEAWNFIERKDPQKATLLMIGSGEEEGRLKKYCESRKLQSVRFPGAVPYDKIHEYYAAADVFVIPTLEDNWSLVVPEAMACGLPILCSCYNGCWPELVQEGVNGWVFNPLDQQDLIQCLEKAIIQTDKLPLMGAKSLEIIAGHGPENAAQSILEACMLAINHFSR